MLRACELGGSVLPVSFQDAPGVLELCRVKRRIDGASLDRLEPLAFLTLSDRTLMTLFAMSSILDAIMSIFSLAKLENVM
jgi:hypothetical protein